MTFTSKSIFVGPFRDTLNDAPAHYRAVIDVAKTMALYSTKAVTGYVDAVPYLLIGQSDRAVLNDIKQIILQSYQGDEETIKMLQTLSAIT
ncbi:hypothetical protein [Planococcus sp. MB-3u-03]|uniref:hypothetical protein n=1 Tax=Planococcus sp. MB-3u-03 TaxID=2058136 RepID=UPI001E4FB153|nr:hypothetical protein [Planococcus sp. MB-3u-03]